MKTPPVKGPDEDARPVAQASKSAARAAWPVGSRFRALPTLRTLGRLGNLRHGRLGSLRHAMEILPRSCFRPHAPTPRIACVFKQLLEVLLTDWVVGWATVVGLATEEEKVGRAVLSGPHTRSNG